MERGLPKITYSKNLQTLANTHVEMLNKMDMVKIKEQHQCNLHSWPESPSNYKYKWSPCCYSTDENAKCMHSKGKELQLYRSNTFEIAYMGYKEPEVAIKAFIDSEDHRIVMFNEGAWKDKWEVVGIGCLNQFTVIWFGNVKE